MNKRIVALPVLAAIGLVGLTIPAAAEEPEIVVTGKKKVPDGFEPVTQVVTIGDLDLTTASGERKLEKRVAKTIKKMCYIYTKPARWQVKDSEDCSAYAWEGARPQMDQAIARAKGG
ncbi:UrcA family protein [Qipengyuania soli]|uniref:UrcA family protein n=1 Tax=Qipengyuania soli TaxID=2782568 RepID=A0A7S8F4D6_9SPHN|nr:UrcA family protein [Qipengyuania soli]QPC98788.1 UrcA family protein [Qipengyuania soli]